MSESHNLKKELKGPDWFHRVADDLAGKLAGHRSTILFVVVALVVIGVGSLFYAQHLKNVEEKAVAQLEVIEEEYYKLVEQKSPVAPAEQWTAVADKLQGLISKESSTGAAALASFYLGEIYFQQGKHAEAVEAYQKYARQLPNSSPLQAMVYSNVGYAFEAQNKPAEAAQHFVRAAQPEGAPLRDQSYINAARNFEKAGKQLEARTYYQKVADNFPESTLQNLAKSKLAQLATAK